MVIFQIIFSNMVILDMVIFSDIRKYGNMPYGNVFRNYYHISTSKYGKIKNLWSRCDSLVVDQGVSDFRIYNPISSKNVKNNKNYEENKFLRYI